MDAQWAADLRDRCIEEGVAFFFKQWGGRTAKSGGRELDGRKWDQMPELVPAG
jgi:protein gp37